MPNDTPRSETTACGLVQTTSHRNQIDYDCAVCGYSTTIQASDRHGPECGRSEQSRRVAALPDTLLLRAAELERQGWALLDQAATLRADADNLEAAHAE